jgi:hypothetical protein
MQQRWMVSFVSLLLLLLVFFMLLTTLARRDAKLMQQAVGGVRQAFGSSNKLGYPGVVPGQKPLTFQQQVRDFFSEIGAAAQGNFPQLFLQRSVDGRVMRLVVPYEMVIDPYNHVTQKSAENFFIELAHLLTSTTAGVEAAVDVALVLPGFFEGEARDLSSSAAAAALFDAGAVARKLINLGASESQITSGVISPDVLRSEFSSPMEALPPLVYFTFNVRDSTKKHAD